MNLVRTRIFNSFIVIFFTMTFSATAAQKKVTTYGTKKTSASSGLRDLSDPFGNIPRRSGFAVKRVEEDKPKATSAKNQQNTISQKQQERTEKVLQEKRAIFAEADAYQLEERFCTDKELSYDRWLHSQWLSRQGSDEIGENRENCESMIQLASVISGEAYEESSDEESSDDKPKKIIPTIPKKERVKNAPYSGDIDRFFSYVREKQTDLTWDIILDPKKGKSLRSGVPLADRFYQIRMNQATTGLLTKEVPNGALVHVTMGMAKKANPVNVQCIDSLLKYSTIKSIKKAQKSNHETFALRRPQCFGWEHGCNDYQKCQHSVTVGGSEYKRYTKVVVSGKTLLKENNPFIRSVMHSHRAGCALHDYIKQSEDYQRQNKQCKALAKDSTEKVAADSKLLEIRKKLDDEWIQKNKKQSRKALKEAYPTGVIDPKEQYSVSVTMPTGSALKVRPALQPLVSMAPIREEVTKNNYGHSPFQQLKF